jgi:hypothetical protein
MDCRETQFRRALSQAHVKAAAPTAADSASDAKSDQPHAEVKQQRAIPNMTPSQLQAEKVGFAVTPTNSNTMPVLSLFQSTLKKRLRQYDTAFEAKYGRKVSTASFVAIAYIPICLALQPEKSDKEPIRHLYQRYHDLKKAIETMPAKPSVDSSGAESDVGSAVTSASGVSYASSAADLASPSTMKGLRKEKRRLQVRLREYEDKFMMDNGRKVKYHRDIAPVAAEYRRYKEIKNTLKIVR